MEKRYPFANIFAYETTGTLNNIFKMAKEHDWEIERFPISEHQRDDNISFYGIRDEYCLVGTTVYDKERKESSWICDGVMANVSGMVFRFTEK